MIQTWMIIDMVSKGLLCVIMLGVILDYVSKNFF